MFAYLSGTVLSIEESRIAVLPTGMGLGLEVFVSPAILGTVRTNDPIELFLHHHITDVSEALFGFGSPDERLLFRKLLKVNGVGGKTALALLSLGRSPLVAAIEKGDEKVLASVSGVGKKTALKIIVELKKELSGEALFANEDAQVSLKARHHEEITDTLVGMGYDKKAVEKTLEAIPEDIVELQDQVIWSIRKLASR